MFLTNSPRDFGCYWGFWCSRGYAGFKHSAIYLEQKYFGSWAMFIVLNDQILKNSLAKCGQSYKDFYNRKLQL